MSEKAESAVVMAQFAEKLSALRQTMNKAEQAMLDSIVANAAFDVDAHGMATFRVNAAAQSAASEGIVSLERAAALERTDPKLADVESHAFTAAERVTFKFDDGSGYVVESAAATGKAAEGKLIEGGIY